MTSRRLSFPLDTVAIAAILSVAFLVRFWSLGSLPAALHPDEMAGLVGVMDELQHRMPLRPFFDYRIFYLPLYGVSEYVSSRFFGYNATAYRFPAVVYGLVTIVCTIGLTRSLTKDRLAGLLAGVVSAILPWEITVSRIAWENAAMLPFLLGGLWALCAGLQNGRRRLVVASALLLGIDAYSYRAALPDALALAITMLALNAGRAWKMRRTLLIAAGVFAAAIAPLVVSVVLDPSFFWRDRHIATHSLATFTGNYLAHFSPFSLFVTGDGNAEHGPAFGVLYLWMLPFIIGGLVLAFRDNRRTGWFLLIWLAIYPLGGALTNDGVPHFLRTLVGAPLAAILCGIGLAAAWRVVRAESFGRLATALFLALVFVAFAQFAQAYFIVYPPVAANAFQYPNRDLFLTLRAHAHEARRICFEDINEMNSLTLFSYYLRDLTIETHERLDPPCMQAASLVVVKHLWAAPPGARLLATIQKYDGSRADAIFLTK